MSSASPTSSPTSPAQPPAGTAAKKRGGRGRAPLTPKEERAVQLYCVNPNADVPLVFRLLLMMLLDTGRRQGDLRHLMWGMIRQGHKLAQIFQLPGSLTKGSPRRSFLCYFSKQTLFLLTAFAGQRRAHGGTHANLPIFGVHCGDTTPASYSTILRYFKIIFRNAIGRDDVNWGTHTPRKTLALNLWEKTHNIFLVQYALGHKSVLTTLRYICYSDAHLIQALTQLRKTRDQQMREFDQIVLRAQKSGQGVLSLQDFATAHPKLADELEVAGLLIPFDPQLAASGSESVAAVAHAIQQSQAEKARKKTQAQDRAEAAAQQMALFEYGDYLAPPTAPPAPAA